MNYYYAYYKSGEIYIAAYEGEEYYDDVTICLSEYGITPGDNEIIMPITFMRENDYKQYLEDLVKRTIKPINYGPYDAIGMLAELKDNWQDICTNLE